MKIVIEKNINYKEKFADIYNNGIKREGAKELLAWIETTDFFTAPASTRYHCACECGLVMHSISVYEALIEKYFDSDDDKESFTVCALLHDLCKANFYKISMRNVKNENTGVWEKRPYYEVDDQFPYGHGEKSVFLIERFLRLKPNEAAAIRWHMGGFDEAVKGGSFAVGLAFNKYPLAVKLHLADLESTYLREKNTSSVNKTF
jgi:hypothetical protein